MYILLFEDDCTPLVSIQGDLQPDRHHQHQRVMRLSLAISENTEYFEWENICHLGQSSYIYTRMFGLVCTPWDELFILLLLLLLFHALFTNEEIKNWVVLERAADGNKKYKNYVTMKPIPTSNCQIKRRQQYKKTATTETVYTTDHHRWRNRHSSEGVHYKSKGKTRRVWFSFSRFVD